MTGTGAIVTDGKFTLLLIDDHPMLRSGLKQLIALDERLQVVAEAGNGIDGLTLAQLHDPDLILLDLNMPGLNGLDTLTQLREIALSGRVVVFSVSDNEEDVISALKRGADGYLLKDMEPEDLLKALHQAAAGQIVLSEALTPILVARLREAQPGQRRDINQLARRERETLQLISDGMTNKAIARKLDISESTVKVHVKYLLKKMNLKSRLEATVWALQNGLH